MTIWVELAIVSLSVAAFFAIVNWLGILGAVIRRLTGGKGGYSCVPLLSIVFASLAWMFGGSFVGSYALIPMVADPATWFLLYLPVMLLRERHNQN